MRVIVLLTVFSLFGCASFKRPDTDLCIVNAQNQNRKCYNMATDYDNEGNLLPTAKAHYKDNKEISDLDKALVVDSEQGIANLKKYLKDLRDAAAASCQSSN